MNIYICIMLSEVIVGAVVCVLAHVLNRNTGRHCALNAPAAPTRLVNGQYRGTQPRTTLAGHPPWLTAGMAPLNQEPPPSYPCCEHCEHMEPDYDPKVWRHRTPCQHGCDDPKPVFGEAPQLKVEPDLAERVVA